MAGERDSSDAEPRLARRDDGVYSVTGPMTFESVPALWRASDGLVPGGGNVELDLGGVTRTDSAGLALLVEWMRRARLTGASVRFRNVPEQMMAIAQTSNLEDLLLES